MLHPGPTGRYLEAVFSPNGRYVCTHASNDATAWVWDLAKRKCIAMMAVSTLLLGCCQTLGGRPRVAGRP